jgi:hypothetical protein
MEKTMTLARIKSKDSKLLDLGFDKSDIDFTLTDYCELVDATGRSIRADKKGYIDDSLPPYRQDTPNTARLLCV